MTRFGSTWLRQHCRWFSLVLVLWISLSDLLWAQTPAPPLPQPLVDAAPTGSPQLQPPTKVDVQPVAPDTEIRQRLVRILQATGWFGDPQVRVDEGVVFLSGRTEREEFKQWAGNLAQHTQDVVAVVNQITVTAPSVWDFRPAVVGLHALWHDLLYSLPFLACGLLIVLLAWGVARVATRGLRRLLQPRLAVALLREVLARAVGVLIFLLGLYLVLRIAGLTRLALTMLGGTGLLGLVIGIAFVTLPRTSWPVSY